MVEIFFPAWPDGLLIDILVAIASVIALSISMRKRIVIIGLYAVMAPSCVGWCNSYIRLWAYEATKCPGVVPCLGIIIDDSSPFFRDVVVSAILLTAWLVWTRSHERKSTHKDW